MKRLPLLVLFLVGCESERDARIRYYNNQLAQPVAQIRIYGSAYAEHRARCDNKRDSLAQWFCDEAKGDAARVKFAQQQALAVYQQMVTDAILSEQDRQDAQANATRLSSE